MFVGSHVSFSIVYILCALCCECPTVVNNVSYIWIPFMRSMICVITCDENACSFVLKKVSSTQTAVGQR